MEAIFKTPPKGVREFISNMFGMSVQLFAMTQPGTGSSEGSGPWDGRPIGLGAKVQRAAGPGTAAGIFSQSGDLFLFGNEHVLAEGPKKPDNLNVHSPAATPTECLSGKGGYTVGVLDRWRLKPKAPKNKANTVDAGRASSDGACMVNKFPSDPTMLLDPTPVPLSDVATKLNTGPVPVKSIGFMSNEVDGKILCIGNFETAYGWFDNQYLLETTSPLQGGDSGSLVVEGDRPVGMVFVKYNGSYESLANPIDEALNCLAGPSGCSHPYCLVEIYDVSISEDGDALVAPPDQPDDKTLDAFRATLNEPAASADIRAGWCDRNPCIIIDITGFESGGDGIAATFAGFEVRCVVGTGGP